MGEERGCGAMDTRVELASLLHHAGNSVSHTTLGTSSRVVKGREKDFTVGVICQANYGSMLDLRVGTVPVGKLLAKELEAEKDTQLEREIKGKANEGSCIVTIAYKTKPYPCVFFFF